MSRRTKLAAASSSSELAFRHFRPSAAAASVFGCAMETASVSTASSSPAAPSPGAMSVKDPELSHHTPAAPTAFVSMTCSSTTADWPEGDPETSEVPTFPAGLKPISKIREGAYGEVFLCRAGRDGTERVAAMCVAKLAPDVHTGRRLLREIRLLSRLQHPNVMRLADLMPMQDTDCSSLCLVLPYMDFDLNRIIYSKTDKVGEAHYQALLCQIFRGLEYLHTRDIVHRDLKPSSILANRACVVRIADFGYARGFCSEEEWLDCEVGVRRYRAPELMLFPAGFWRAADMWSAGCIHVEMLKKRPLFQENDASTMLRLIFSAVGFDKDKDLAWLPDDVDQHQILDVISALNLPEKVIAEPFADFLVGVPADAVDLVTSCLDLDPSRRISTREALNHPYLVHLRRRALCLGSVGPLDPFPWDIEGSTSTPEAIKRRVFEECTRFHPELRRSLSPELMLPVVAMHRNGSKSNLLHSNSLSRSSSKGSVCPSRTRSVRNLRGEISPLGVPRPNRYSDGNRKGMLDLRVIACFFFGGLVALVVLLYLGYERSDANQPAAPPLTTPSYRLHVR